MKILLLSILSLFVITSPVLLIGQVLEWDGYWAGGYISGIPADPWLVLQPTSAYNFQIIDTGYNVVTNFSLPIPASAVSYSVVAASPDFDTDANIEVLYQYMDDTYYKYRAFLRDINTSSNQLAFSDNDTSYYAYTFYFGNERVFIITGTYDSSTHAWLYRSNDPQDVDESEKGDAVPLSFLNLYPNPALKFSEIHFAVPREGTVTVAIHDAAGRKLATIVDAVMPEGTYTVPWYGTDDSNLILPSGTYYCIVTVNEHRVSEKLILLR